MFDIEEFNLGLPIKPGGWIVTEIPEDGKTDFVCITTFPVFEAEVVGESPTAFIAVKWLPKGEATYLFGVLGREVRLAGSFDDAMHELAQLAGVVLQYGEVCF